MEELVAHWRHAAGVAAMALQAGRAPDLSALPPDVQQSLAGTLAGAVVFLVFVVPRTRTLVLETAEAVLTIGLLVVLIGIVLGLPVGVLYLSYRGLLFLVTSVGGSVLAHVPGLEGLLRQAQQHLQALLPTLLGLLGQHGAAATTTEAAPPHERGVDGVIGGKAA